LWPFDILYGVVCGPLVYFSRFGMFCPRKIWQPCIHAIWKLSRDRRVFARKPFSIFDHDVISLMEATQIRFKEQNVMEMSEIQGCQIFRGTTYQNGENLPNDHKIYQMVVKYSKWPQNIPTLSFARSFKIYPYGNFGFENIPSGNPGEIKAIYLLHNFQNIRLN
jgi:hypothetical protein